MDASGIELAPVKFVTGKIVPRLEYVVNLCFAGRNADGQVHSIQKRPIRITFRITALHQCYLIFFSKCLKSDSNTAMFIY